MLMFSQESVKGFVHKNKAQRWGQAFHGFMKLQKVTNQQDKNFCDKLYNADEKTAKAMVESRTYKDQ